MPQNGHLEWTVKYQPGILFARGYVADKVILESNIDSPGDAAAVRLIPDRSSINADGEDVSVVTVQVTDFNGVIVPNGTKIASAWMGREK